MRKKLSLTTLAVTFWAVVFVTSAFAQPRFHEGGQHDLLGPSEKAQVRQMIAKRLGITDEQKSELRKLREKRKEIREMGQELRSERKELISLLRANESDREEVKTRLERVNQLMADFNNTRVESLLKLKEVLTPQQRSKLRKFMKSKRQMHQQHMGQMGGRGQGYGNRAGGASESRASEGRGGLFGRSSGRGGGNQLGFEGDVGFQSVFGGALPF